VGGWVLYEGRNMGAIIGLLHCGLKSGVIN
jgi:hypothetical protein